MKSLIIAVAFLVGLQFNLSAQTQANGQRRPINPERRAHVQTERMVRDLTLNAEQKKKVYDINLHSASEMARLKEQGGESREAIKTLRQQTQKELRAVLTTEQFRKFRSLQAERRKKLQESRGQADEQEPSGQYDR